MQTGPVSGVKTRMDAESECQHCMVCQRISRTVRESSLMMVALCGTLGLVPPPLYPDSRLLKDREWGGD